MSFPTPVSLSALILVKEAKNILFLDSIAPTLILSNQDLWLEEKYFFYTNFYIIFAY